MDLTEVRDTLSRSVEGIEALDNRQRALTAFKALEVFAKVTGLSDSNEDVDTVVIDLLSNLLHLADATGISFPDVYQTAVGHHAAEMIQQPQAPVSHESLTYRCPECDTYSGHFEPSENGYMVHSVCGREGLVSSFTPGTPEFERVYEGKDYINCTNCDGSGEVRHPRWGARDCPEPSIPCPVCGGTGEVHEIQAERQPSWGDPGQGPEDCCCNTNPGECPVHEPNYEEEDTPF